MSKTKQIVVWCSPGLRPLVCEGIRDGWITTCSISTTIVRLAKILKLWVLTHTGHTFIYTFCYDAEQLRGTYYDLVLDFDGTYPEPRLCDYKRLDVLSAVE